MFRLRVQESTPHGSEGATSFRTRHPRHQLTCMLPLSGDPAYGHAHLEATPATSPQRRRSRSCAQRRTTLSDSRSTPTFPAGGGMHAPIVAATHPTVIRLADAVAANAHGRQRRRAAALHDVHNDAVTATHAARIYRATAALAASIQRRGRLAAALVGRTHHACAIMGPPRHQHCMASTTRHCRVNAGGAYFDSSRQIRLGSRQDSCQAPQGPGTRTEDQRSRGSIDRRCRSRRHRQDPSRRSRCLAAATPQQGSLAAFTYPAIHSVTTALKHTSQ
jgi:hypothetical protein